MSEERYHITYAEKRHPDAPDEYIIASDAQLTMYDHAEELHMACEHAIAMMEDVPGAKDFFSVRAELRSIIYRCQGQTPPDSDTDALLMMFWLRSKGRCGADAKNSCRRIEQCQRTEGGRGMLVADQQQTLQEYLVSVNARIDEVAAENNALRAEIMRLNAQYYEMNTYGCPDCHGDGEIKGIGCFTCNGHGVLYTKPNEAGE